MTASLDCPPSSSSGEGATLVNPKPTGRLPARVTIHHPQLRDLILCPDERGVVTYLSRKSVVRQDIHHPKSRVTLAKLPFSANCLAISPRHNLLAAGGQHGEVHLSSLSSSEPWSYHHTVGSSINNSLFFTSLSMTESPIPSPEPRLVLCNNDQTVKFFTVATRTEPEERGQLETAGETELPTAVNHASLSPDGRTLIAGGDTPVVHLYHVTGGSTVTCEPITTYSTSSIDLNRHPCPSAEAIFSTAFSPSGLKFAVGSQNGVVSVWDVRSSKRLAVYKTNPRPRSPYARDEDEPMGVRWGARNVKFVPGEGGKELLVFTEHTSNVHIVDARTFNEHQIISVPPSSSISPSSSPSPPPQTQAPPPPQSSQPPQSHSRSPSPPSSPSRSRYRHIFVPPQIPSNYIPVLSPSYDEPPLNVSSRTPSPPDDLPTWTALPFTSPPPRSPRAFIRAHSAVPSANISMPPYPGPIVQTAYPSNMGPQRRYIPFPRNLPGHDLDDAEDHHTDELPTQISGMCFSPDGGYLYVGTEHGINEWEVEGHGRRWWYGDWHREMI